MFDPNGTTPYGNEVYEDFDKAVDEIEEAFSFRASGLGEDGESGIPDANLKFIMQQLALMVNSVKNGIGVADTD